MAFSFPDLKGKTFAVTGASSGMGRATALLLAKQGANVGLMDITSPDKVAAEIAQIAGDGHSLSLPVDVTNADAVNNAFLQLLEKFGRIDGAANMAGTVGSMKFGKAHHGIENLNDADWDMIQRINTDGVKNCLRAEFRTMKGPGSIVNAASISGQAGNPFATPYSSSKWAVIGITKGAAGEVGSRGIRVNAVAPGIVRTALVETLGEESMEKLLTPRIALGKLAEADDVARVIVFLFSDAASYITGTVVNVDGGYA